jgi:hypothetical protein
VTFSPGRRPGEGRPTLLRSQKRFDRRRSRLILGVDARASPVGVRSAEPGLQSVRYRRGGQDRRAAGIHGRPTRRVHLPRDEQLIGSRGRSRDPNPPETTRNHGYVTRLTCAGTPCRSPALFAIREWTENRGVADSSPALATKSAANQSFPFVVGSNGEGCEFSDQLPRMCSGVALHARALAA